jgi:hypothetical protein
LTRDKARRGKACDKSENTAKDDRLHSLLNDQPVNGLSLRAEGDADTNFTTASSDNECDDSVDADHCEEIHEHFPNAELTTYCSEEPCFTSALPGILKSFRFKHAVLKNPNTCWGGYPGRTVASW